MEEGEDGEDGRRRVVGGGGRGEGVKELDKGSDAGSAGDLERERGEEERRRF